MCFVMLSEMLSTTLVKILRNKSDVHACIYKCYTMPHDFFQVFRMQVEVLSPTYISWTPIYHTGYPLAINSHDRIPQQILQDIQSYHISRTQRILKVFGGYKFLQTSNSASMCKFRPVGHNSIDAAHQKASLGHSGGSLGHFTTHLIQYGSEIFHHQLRRPSNVYSSRVLQCTQIRHLEDQRNQPLQRG